MFSIPYPSNTTVVTVLTNDSKPSGRRSTQVTLKIEKTTAEFSGVDVAEVVEGKLWCGKVDPLKNKTCL